MDQCNWAPVKRNERMAEMVRLFQHSKRYVDATDGRSGITGQQHALRCAALAKERASFRELAFLGLIHDLARPLNDVHHGEIMAEMVRDRVSTDSYNILRTHGQFQSALVHKTPFPFTHSVWHRDAVQLASFEAASFSDAYSGPVMGKDEAMELMRTYLG